MNRTRTPQNRRKSESDSISDSYVSVVHRINLMLAMPFISIAVFLVICVVGGGIASLFTPPSTRIGGLAIDEDSQPVRSTVVVFLDNTVIARTPSETDVSVDETCSPKDYNYELTIQWNTSESPQARCGRLMVPNLKTGESWTTTTTDGEHIIVVQNLGNSDQIPPYITSPTGEVVTGTVTGNLSAQSPIQANPLVQWSVILVIFFSLGLVVFFVVIRPNWQTITNLTTRWRDTSRKDKALSKFVAMHPNIDTHPEFLSDLRRGLADCFSVSELRTLCADLGVNYEDLTGEGKEAKTRELIFYLDRRGQLSELLVYCASTRPRYTWPQVDGNALLAVPSSVGFKATMQITVLFLSADPSDLSRLRLGEELREIQEKLQLARFRDHFDLQQRMSIRPADISQALLDVQPRIVHFSGHGTHTGALCLEDQQGRAKPTPPEALAALFEQFVDHVDCVVLNACYSKTQAKAIAEHICYVIGMNKAIGDKAAIAFAIGFYQTLGAGRTIEDAYKLGCVQIMLQGIPEHLTPVLINKNKRATQP